MSRRQLGRIVLRGGSRRAVHRSNLISQWGNNSSHKDPCITNHVRSPPETTASAGLPPIPDMGWSFGWVVFVQVSGTTTKPRVL